MDSAASTFPSLLLLHAVQRPHAPALRAKRHGIWQPLSWLQLSQLVRELACGLLAAGLQRGDRLAIIGSHRPRLQAAMLAAQALGAVPLPLYPDASASELEPLLRRARARWAIVEDQAQVDKLLELRLCGADLQQIWFDDPRGLRRSSEAGLQWLDVLIAAGRQSEPTLGPRVDAEIAQTTSEDGAVLYVSADACSEPKLMLHTHRSLLEQAQAAAHKDSIGRDEEVLACLPPAWIGQWMLSFVQWMACGYVVNCPESAQTLANDMREIGPTYHVAPPQVFERTRADVLSRMAECGRFRRGAFNVFMAVAARIDAARQAGTSPSTADRCLHALGERVWHRPLRSALGMARVRRACSADGPIAPEVLAFYRAIGVALRRPHVQSGPAERAA